MYTYEQLDVEKDAKQFFNISETNKFAYEENTKYFKDVLSSNEIKDVMKRVICCFEMCKKYYKLNLFKTSQKCAKFCYKHIHSSYGENTLRLAEVNVPYCKFFMKSMHDNYEDIYPAYSAYDIIYGYYVNELNNEEIEHIELLDSPIDKSKFLVRINKGIYLRYIDHTNEFPKNDEGYIEAAIGILKYYYNKGA